MDDGLLYSTADSAPGSDALDRKHRGGVHHRTGRGTPSRLSKRRRVETGMGRFLDAIRCPSGDCHVGNTGVVYV